MPNLGGKILPCTCQKEKKRLVETCAAGTGVERSLTVVPQPPSVVPLLLWAKEPARISKRNHNSMLTEENTRAVHCRTVLSAVAQRAVMLQLERAQ